MKYSDEQRIQKILMYSKKLNDYIEENGITKEKLMREYALQWLVTTPLYNIGEHAYYISKEYKAEHSDIPWGMISGLRHRLVHDYDGTNWSIISDVVFEELPQLILQIQIWAKLYAAAKAVQQERQISDYVLAGGVAAAVLSKSGRIYTGVCIDTCSTLGICAERNAIFNMITNGEQEIDKVLCILPDGSGGTPCGACRELMVQLMPNGRYKDIEIMMDYAAGRIVKLGEITPEWWIK